RVAAGPAEIHEVRRPGSDFYRLLAEGPREAHELLHALALHPQRHEQAADLLRRKAPEHDPLHHIRCLTGRERAAADDPIERALQQAPPRSRKLARIVRPPPVAIDSGWNCTPLTGQ